MSTEMDLPTERNPCRNCGQWAHEHEKTKVFGDGRWHWEYTCLDDPSHKSFFDRLRERTGGRGEGLFSEYLGLRGRR